MKKNLWIIAAVVVLVILIGGYLVMNSSNVTTQKSTAQNTVPTTQGTKPGLLDATTPVTVYDVIIKDFAFKGPNNSSDLIIKAGDSINWKNKDIASHTITSDSGNELNSVTLATGGTYEHRFLTAGTYTYHCSIHPAMKGTITVQ